MRIFVRFSVLLLLVQSVFAISFAQPYSRKKILFDNDWHFSFGNASDPARDFNYGAATVFSKTGKAETTAIDPKFNDEGWRKLDLPHDWAVELPFVKSENADVMAHGYKPVGGLFPETSIGWYRKHFTIAKADSGKRFEIQFDGIFRDANIWLNGCYLGNNQSGYTGVSYDITDYINLGGDNVLVVRADATQYEGWFYEGAGIYRHVWLNQYHNVHIPADGHFIYSDVQGKKALLTIESTVVNKGDRPADCSIYSYVTDRGGKKLFELPVKTVHLLANETGTIKQSIGVNNPRLWSLEDPYLYRAVSLVKLGKQTADSLKTRFGIRTIKIDAARGLFLNGKHVKVLGTNNHQDHGGLGSALPDYMQYYRIKLLKEMGSNAYRTSHHAPAPELLEACDSLGMLVMDEQRLLNSSPEYAGQFDRLIKRDRNHPSVFMWSIGNEEGMIQSNSVGKRVAQTLIARQKQLDPTRTCTYAADLPNVFTGVNEVIPVRGFNYRQFAVADYHRDHPLQPVIGTEMGSTVTTRGIYEKDSVRAYVPDQDITAPWWASRAEEWWKLAAANDYWMGGFIWTGFDYRGEPTPYKWPNISSHFGVMDICGFPKNIYYYYKSWWTDEDVLHISPHWNWKGREGKMVNVWVNSNADYVELFLNGKSLGSKEMPVNSHLEWNVPYAPGILEAVALKKGKRLSAKVETTSGAHEVVITPYKTTMLADGRDVGIINVSVVDKEGREVPDANDLIRFSISGAARIIGVANGDPSSHEPDKCKEGSWQRSLFNGKCQLIVQAGVAQSEIKIEATAEGLQSATSTIQSIAAPAGKIKMIDPSGKAKASAKPVDRMIGADISFLPQLEEAGVKFKDQGVLKDPILILKDHGFNYIRLRIFNNPSVSKGYSPGKGYCDLGHTKQMAKRVKDAGLKRLLDFHYSDYWADPQQQNKPSEWNDLPMDQLSGKLYAYTKTVMQELKSQGTSPDMVQIGNEVNHGMVWPEGSINNLDSLAALIKSGVRAVREVSPATVIMLHVALGGQNEESQFFYDNMLARGVEFDVIGESFYPKWHGTLNDLKNNLDNLANRYNKDVIVVEYSQLKKEVNDIAFNVAGGRGKGACIWEPLNTWESVFDKQGYTNELINEYQKIREKYLEPPVIRSIQGGR